MHPKVFLLQAQTLQAQISDKEDRICELRTLAEKATTLLSPVAGGSHDDRKLENITVQIAELEEELAVLRRRRDDKIIEITNVLSQMSKTTYSVLLMEHYVELKSIADMATDHKYSKRYTERLLRVAYDAYRRLYEGLLKDGKIGQQQAG